MFDKACENEDLGAVGRQKTQSTAKKILKPQSQDRKSNPCRRLVFAEGTKETSGHKTVRNPMLDKLNPVNRRKQKEAEKLEEKDKKGAIKQELQVKAKDNDVEPHSG